MAYSKHFASDWTNKIKSNSDHKIGEGMVKERELCLGPSPQINALNGPTLQEEWGKEDFFYRR